MIEKIIIFLCIILIVIIIVIIKIVNLDKKERLNIKHKPIRRRTDYIKKILIKELPNNKYFILNNVKLAIGNGTITIDYIIVSVRGLFIIQIKSWVGSIIGNPESDKWKQIIHQKNFLHNNPIKENEHYIKLLQKILKLPTEYFFNIIVFDIDCILKSFRINNVLYAKELTDYILSLHNIILTPVQAKAIIKTIQKIRK